MPAPKLNNGISVIVAGVNSMLENEGETFVTQRGGKIIQGALPSISTETNKLLENKRTLQSTLLLQKKKEMEKVQTLLEQKRVEFTKRMEECREKQEELRSKQKQIRERVLKFEKFLKENDAKRQRANAKAMAERKLVEAKEQELVALKQELLREQTKSRQVISLIKKNQKYETYLQSIVDILPPDYLDVNEPHINDIIMRHKTLTETNLDLISVVRANQDEVEVLQGKLAALIKEKNDLILVSNSQLGTLQKHLDQLKQHSVQHQQRIEERENTMVERMRLLSETRMAIDDLYERCSRKASAKVDDANETQLEWPQKLHVLQFRVLDLQGMWSST